MYKVEAIIRPEVLEEVKYGLLALGCDEMVVSAVYGNEDSHPRTAWYRGVRYDLPLVHQLRIEVAVIDSMVDAVIERIVKLARTGQPGDGKIFVSKLADVIDIDGGQRPLVTTGAGAPPRPRLAATAGADRTSAR